ncbi:MAG: DUF2283 domain-containing protein [Candidatus Chisholmbacteria bacterium]|nr:DUF2283 domain-containing protein [Candidatus Chisholmbacteria bacterium]
MKAKYDPVADAMYIYFSERKKSTRTEEVSEDILVDYSGREMVGIEILDASKKLPRKNLASLKTPAIFGTVSAH